MQHRPTLLRATCWTMLLRSFERALSLSSVQCNFTPNPLSIRPVTVFSGFRSHCQKSHRILWQDPQDFNKMVNFSSVFLFLILGTKVYNSLPTRWRPGCPELPRVEMRGKKLEGVTGTVLYLQPEGVGLSFSVIKVMCQRESLFLPTWHLNWLYAQNLLRSQFHLCEGLEDITLGLFLQFSVQSSEFIHILHGGGMHWVCVSNTGCQRGEVN